MLVNESCFLNYFEYLLLHHNNFFLLSFQCCGSQSVRIHLETGRYPFSAKRLFRKALLTSSLDDSARYYSTFELLLF